MNQKESRKYHWERSKDQSAEDENARPGAVNITEHPIGVLVILAIVWIAVTNLPATIAFFAISLTLGSVIGFFLWRKHR